MWLAIATIEHVFAIKGGKVVVIPGTLGQGAWRARVGDTIRLERPDGSPIETIVRGVEMGARSREPITPLMLGSEITKDMVPIGMKLWIEQP